MCCFKTKTDSKLYVKIFPYLSSTQLPILILHATNIAICTKPAMSVFDHAVIISHASSRYDHKNWQDFDIVMNLYHILIAHKTVTKKMQTIIFVPFVIFNNLLYFR